MNPAEQSQLQQVLRGRRDAIADSWYKAIARTCFVPLSAAEVRQQLLEWTEQVIALLLLEPFECGRAEAIGASLAGLHCIEPEALGRTQEVLAQQFVEGLSADQVVVLQPRLGTSLSGLAAGFFRQARETILAEQEWIHGALTTARKRAGAELRESEERYRSLFERVPVGLYRTTLDGQILDVNPAAVEMLGYPDRGSLLAVNAADVYVDCEDRRQEQVLLERQGLVNNFAVQLHRRDGRVIWVKDTARAMRDADGRVLYYEGALEDITEQVRAQKALRESQQLLEMTFASLSDAVLIIDADTEQIVDCNLAVSGVFGYSRREMIGRRATFLDVDEAAKDKFRVHPHPAVEGKGFLSESKMKRKDGTLFPAERSVTPLKDEQGKHIGWVSVVRDITERKRAEEELKKCHDRLAEMVEERMGELEAANEQLRREIAERKRAEEALCESEEKYRNLVERANDGIAIVQDTIVKYANRRSVAMWGGSIEQIIGTPFTDYVHPDELPKIVDRYKRRMAGEDVTPIYETVFRRRDGSEVYVELNAGMITHQGKAADLVMVRDITERKRAEEALERSERLYRAAIEGAGAVPYSRNYRTNSYEFVGPGIEALTGYSAEGFTPELWDSIVQEAVLLGDFKGLSVDEAEQKARSEEGIAWRADYRIVTRGGEERWLANSAVYVRGEQRRAVRSIGILQDITERKRAEEALQKAHDELEMRVQERTAELAKANEALQAEITERKRVEEALRQSEEKYRTLIENTNDIVFSVDAEARLMYASPQVKRLGMCPEEIVSRELMEFVLPEDRERVLRDFQHMMMTGEELPTEFRVPDKEGCIHWFEHVGKVQHDESGKIVGVTGVLRDIAARKRAEERLLAYQERLRSLASELSLSEGRERRRIAMELHSRICQTLALSKIKLGALRESATSTHLIGSLDEIRELVEEIIHDTRSLIFEISSPILYELGLEAAVEQLTEQILEQHRIQSYLEDDRQPKPLDEDIRVLLFQAVRELLINVAKHAQARNVKVSITRDGDNIRITVEDDGVGFEATRTGFPYNTTGGFGLFSIRERLDHLDGHLEVESEPGHGTRATLIAPLRRDGTARREE